MNTKLASNKNTFRPSVKSNMNSDRSTALIADKPKFLSLSQTSPTPRFHQNQHVYFLGGKGTVKNCRSDSGTWTYAVEMELGPEPEMGRIGFETTILLDESDILEAADC